MRGHTLQRLFAVALAFSMLLSTITPALADQGWPSAPGAVTPAPADQVWPSERGAVAPATVAPATVAPSERGPVAVPSELRVAPASLAEESLSQAGASAVNPAVASRFERVPADAAVNLPGHSTRDFNAKPTTISGNTKMGPGVAALAAQGGKLVGLVFHLDKPSLAEAGVGMTGTQRAAYAQEVAAYQDKVIAEVEASGGALYARFTTLSSGFIAFVPPQQIPRLVGMPEVLRVALANDYEQDLSETVPFIGAQALQDLGLTGKGVKVAVLDSGLDFTHLAFGGPGTEDDWLGAYFGADPACDWNAWSDPDCAYAKPANPALFGPNAPVVKGGYDWLGEEWPNAAARILPDPNPVDVEGHGTHVADIIGGQGYPAGTNADGAYPAKGAGVAPDTEIYSFKVCASYSTSCNGLAMLKSLDNAADLDGNPTTVDPADVVNMSLGSPYGQPEDDSTYFTNQLAKLGVIVVASAGNSADKPFIVGSPSMADGAISVAQTTVPSATRYPLFYKSSATEGTINTTVWQPYSTLPGATKIEGPVVYGNADGSNKNGCAAYTDNMAGKVVLSDRGACNFSLKAKNASAAGAVLSLIGLVAPGDPFEGGDGGDRPIDIPAFMILQSSSTLLKNQIANGVVAGIDPAQAINLAYTIVGSSSRGPRNHDGVIKPDISAPGASVSALATSGAGIGAFGGTSGAAPMVSGAMALLKGVYGDTLLPQQFKALAMNTGDAIWNGVPYNDLSPATRQGGGQVNARSAFFSKLIAWDSTDTAAPLSWTGSLSFGYVPASEYQAYTRTLTIQNLGQLDQGITIDSFFRSGEDAGLGVFVTPLVKTATVPAGGSIQVPVRLEIFPAGDEALGLDPLHPWVVNRGDLGANGLALQFQEYDGLVVISPKASDPIHVVWQVLPKAVADITVSRGPGLSNLVTLDNASPGVAGETDVFDLMVADANDYNYTIGDCATLGLPSGCNMTAIDIKEVGVRSYTDTTPNDILEFAVTLWDKPFRAGQYPAEFDIYIDSDADGTDDYVIFNGDLTLNASDGRNIVFLKKLPSGAAQPWYFIDSTFNSNNFILPMDAESIGVTPGQPFRFSVFAYDAYFTGELWDCAPKVGNMCTGAFQYTPGMARFQVMEDDLFPTVPAAGKTEFTYTFSKDGDKASPDQIGLLFLHRNALVGRESDTLLLPKIYSTYLPLVLNTYNASEWLNLTILHTNDFHARVDEYNVGGDACTTPTNCIGGSSRLATLVDDIRGKTPNVLLVDAGDQFQGTLYYNLFKSEVVAKMMNAIGYDAMTVGNHEFDDGPAELAKLDDSANFPIVSTNLDVSKEVSLTGKLVPYTIVARGGHNIGVLGVTTPELPDISSPGPNVVVKDPATSVQATVDTLKGQGINKIVLLSHLGYDADKALAADVSGVDVIIGGHSHTFLYDPATAQTFTPPNLALMPAGAYPTVVGGAAAETVVASAAAEPVLIITAFEWGKFLGQLDVNFNPAGLITKYDGNPIYVSNSVAKDAAIETMLAPYRDDVNAMMTLKVGEITVDAPISVGGKRICRLGECLMGNLVTDAMLWQVNTVGGGDYQIAVTNGGGLRAPLLKGDVTYGGVMGVLPFGNTIATMGLKGVDLLAALEHSVRLYPAENGGFLQVSGMRYTFDPGAPAGARIVRAEMWNGAAYEPIVPDTVYKVVTNNFTRNGGDGYIWFRNNAIDPYDFGPALHEAVIDYFETFSPVTPVLEGRIGQPSVITILHTNDTHGRWEVDSYGGGMLRLATLIEEQRKRNPNTILLDAGDTFQGNAFAYFFKDDPDNPIAGGMELLDYDAMMVGNHEFNFGPTTFQTMIGQVDFPVLGSANLTDDGSYGLAAAGVQDYTKLTVDGKDVVIWGFTNPRVPRYELPSNIVGLTFEPFTTTFQSDVPAIIAAEKPDLFIALNHLGYEPYAGEDESDVLMAKGVAGIDVIVGSHSHTKLDPSVMVTSTVNPTGTLIAQTQAYASYLGVVDVGFVGDEIVYRRGHLIAANTVITPNAALQTYLAPYQAEINVYNGTVIGKTSVPLDALKAYTEETNAANLQTDAAAWAMAKAGHPVDFHLSGAMANRKVANAATPATPVDITKGDMFTLMPYENSLVVLELNGAQLKNILERGYRNYWYYKYGAGFTPPYGGLSRYTTCMLDVSDGAVITYSDPGAGTPPNGSNVVGMTLNGNPVDFSAASTYTVSSVNYLVAGSCNFNDDGATIWPLDQITYDSQVYVRDSVTDYVATLPQPIAPAVEGRLVFQAP